MKYLLAAIDARRSAVPLDDAELRKLLTDVRKSKDDKSEMNEAMERLITELKGSEHATAFLTRVSKREAPDYYEVIKHPMDLGTMLRNVKASKYKNKNAFAADLELIWSNCEMYNMLPEHALRKAAAHMRAQSRHLLAYVHEGDEVGEALRLWEKRSDAAAKAKVFGTDGAGPRVATRLPLARPLVPPPPSSAVTITPLAMRPALVRDAADMARFSQLESLDFLEEDASQATTSANGARLLAAARTSRSRDDLLRQSGSGPIAASVPDLADPSGSADGAWYSLSSGDLLMAGVPHLPSSVRLPLEDEEAGAYRVRKRNAFGGQAMVRRNISTIAKLRHTSAKLAALAAHTDLDTPLPAWLASTSSDEESEDDEMPVRTRRPVSGQTPEQTRHPKGAVALEPGLNPLGGISPQSAREGLHSAAMLLGAHVGFDGAHTSCMDVITDMAGEFLGNLGRTLRLYADRYSHEMSVEELLLHTLQENGGASVRSLETYVVDDVERHGTRLTDMLRRNRAAYRERLQASSAPMADDAFFSASNDVLVSGGFAEELGDDFFGFKAMGLDAETGMSGLSVPARLFRATKAPGQRRHEADPSSAEEPLAFPPPPPAVPISESAVGAQIGLLQSWYRDLVRTRGAWRAHSPGTAEATGVAGELCISDDEQERQRFKVGPTGRLPKRTMASTAAAQRGQGAETLVAAPPARKRNRP